MPPRKKSEPFASTQKFHREAKLNAHSAHSHAVQLESQSVADYNGPIRSRALRGHSPPIHSLPLEVLSEILIFTLPTNQELHKKHFSERRKLINPPLVFCAVCSSWRILMFSTPRLWKKVFIHVWHNINEAQAVRKASGLVQWIERSRPLALTLHISGDPITPRNGEGPKVLIISIISDHAARWDSLYFQPLLSLFHFDMWHSLRRLYSPFWNRMSCANETIPWAHLTHLQIRIPCQDAALIFMQCSKLVYLSMVVYPPIIG